MGGNRLHIVGRLLGGVFYLLGKARTGRQRALHPTGQVLRAVLHRDGSPVPTGVPWVDEAGTDEVVVRLSRATGLPKPLPDVLGLALRISLDGGGHGDLLLSTTGLGRVTRFLLKPVRQVSHGYTTLFPYRTAHGPLLLAAIPTNADGTTFRLSWARPTGDWQRFGALELLTTTCETDSDLPFDPAEHPMPGLPSYGWAAALRRHAYAASRRARGVWVFGWTQGSVA